MKRKLLLVPFTMVFLLLFSCAQGKAKFVLLEGLPLISEEGAAVPVVQLEMNQNIDLFSFIRAIDENGNDVSDRIELVSGSLNPKKAGKYRLKYQIKNLLSIENFEIEVVVRPYVNDSEKFIPKIIMLDKEGIPIDDFVGADLFFEIGTPFVDPGFQVEDGYDLEIPQKSMSTTYYYGDRVDENKKIATIPTLQRGYYTILYTAINSLGNSGKATRHVQIHAVGEVSPKVKLTPYEIKSEGEANVHVINPTLQLGFPSGKYIEKGFLIEELKYNYSFKGEKKEGIISMLSINEDYLATHRSKKDPKKIEILDLANGKLVAYLEVSSLPKDLLPIKYEISYLMVPASGIEGIAPLRKTRNVFYEDTNPPELSFKEASVKKVTVKPQDYLPRPEFEIKEDGDLTLEQTQVVSNYFLITKNSDGTETKVPVSSFPQKNDLPGTQYQIEYTIQDFAGNTSAPLIQEVLVLDGSVPYIEYEEGFNELFFYDNELTPENVYQMLSDPSISAMKILDVGSVDNNGNFGNPVQLNYSSAAPKDGSGYFKINLGQLQLNQPGTYTVYYYAEDSASLLEVDGKPVLDSWNADGRIANNAKEYARRIHILDRTEWLNGEFCQYQADGSFILKWKDAPYQDYVTQFEIQEFKGNSNDLETSRPLFLEANARQCTVKQTIEGNHFAIRAHYRRPSNQVNAAPFNDHKAFTVVPQSRKVYTTQGQIDKIHLSWDKVINADGYFVYAATPEMLAAMDSATERSSCQIADLLNENVGIIQFDYRKNANCNRFLDAGLVNIQPDGKFGCPPGRVYFWVEPYVNPASHHSNGEKIKIGKVDWNSLSDWGYRAMPNDEACSLSLEMAYLACKDLTFTATPWNDYWNATVINANQPGGDKYYINHGSDLDLDPRDFNFDIIPWKVPAKLTGKDGTTKENRFINYTNRLLYKKYYYDGIEGKAVTEAVRTKENEADGLNGEDYVMSRWWMHDLYFFNGEFCIEKGWRVYEHNWNNRQVQRLKLNVYDKVANRHWTFLFDWGEGENSDSDYRKIAGPCFLNGKKMKVSFDGEQTWNEFTYDKSKHFSW